jgi:hypothetical protein
MNRKTIKAAVDAIILLRYAENEVAPSDAAEQEPQNTSNVPKEDVLSMPLKQEVLTNEQIYGKLLPSLYLAGGSDSDPIKKIELVIENQVKQSLQELKTNLKSMTPDQKEIISNAVNNALENYLKGFGTLFEFFDLGE